MNRVAWVDAGSGASGDMLLGALVDAGVPVGVLAEAVDKVAPQRIRLEQESVLRNGLVATRCHVLGTEVFGDAHTRTWRDVEELLAGAGLREEVRCLVHDAFARLAEAEGVVHGVPAEEVHFHEVGALDAIADVVGVCAGVVHLGLDRLVVSPVAVGGGSVDAAHGRLPVPVPAVVELLRGVPSVGGPVDVELCTPTGAALLTTLADEWGVQPAMSVDTVGVGAGGRDLERHPNVLRLLLGATAETRRPAVLLLETNVDDLDPRLWPGVLATLLEVGASDAWLSPIMMKKGRPAHTLHVLVTAELLDVVRMQVYRQTSTIGMRVLEIGKHALDRELAEVLVGGQPIAVKLASSGGVVLNAMPEFEDCAQAAAVLGRPVKDVLEEAVTAARLARPRSL